MDLATGTAETDAGYGALGQGLDFLWLELTYRCNLNCVHCYTDSGPYSGNRDLLTVEDYRGVMRQARDLGCLKLQLIGGEPQLSKDFGTVLTDAKAYGFGTIEVFTNLTKLEPATVAFAAANDIRFLTSIHSSDETAHDAITRVRTSHARSLRNLRVLLEAGVPTSAAVTVVDQAEGDVAETERFLRAMGVQHVTVSPTRKLGRAKQMEAVAEEQDALCGHCWAGKLCITPDGTAYPCVMARHSPVGNVRETPLAEIVQGAALSAFRRRVRAELWAGAEDPTRQTCVPDQAGCEVSASEPLLEAAE